MNEIKLYTPNDVPAPLDGKIIFLAGSIEMGTARKWQEELFDKVCKDKWSTKKISVMNPYRSDWDSNIGNTIEDERFSQQVEWEWDGLLRSDLVVFNFEPETKSPISLMELGAMVTLGKNIIVCCPKEFWKYGNVEFICNKYKNCILVHDFSDLILKFSTEIENYIDYLTDTYQPPSNSRGLIDLSFLDGMFRFTQYPVTLVDGKAHAAICRGLEFMAVPELLDDSTGELELTERGLSAARAFLMSYDWQPEKHIFYQCVYHIITNELVEDETGYCDVKPLDIPLISLNVKYIQL